MYIGYAIKQPILETGARLSTELSRQLSITCACRFSSATDPKAQLAGLYSWEIRPYSPLLHRPYIQTRTASRHTT